VDEENLKLELHVHLHLNAVVTETGRHPPLSAAEFGKGEAPVTDVRKPSWLPGFGKALGVFVICGIIVAGASLGVKGFAGQSGKVEADLNRHLSEELAALDLPGSSTLETPEKDYIDAPVAVPKNPTQTADKVGRKGMEIFGLK
jgi:hypothetical protein